MEISKLHTIIANKNERLERDALDEAESIIEQIALKQEYITKFQAEIDSLRKKLTELEVKQLDSQKLLGQ